MGAMSKMSALLVAHEREFKHVKYVNTWNEYKVYEAYNDGGVAYIGLPQMILVDKNRKARWATYDEIMAWTNDEEVKENYNGNYSTSNNLETKENIETEKEKISNILENMSSKSKNINKDLELYFNILMENEPDKDEEFMSLPIIDMSDKSNIKLSALITSYIITENGAKHYICQGYVTKDFNYKSIPNVEYYKEVEPMIPELSILIKIPDGEYSNLTIDELKEKYFILLDTLKELVIKDKESITYDEAMTVLDYLKLYKHLETKEIQAYQSLKSDFITWCIVTALDTKNDNITMSIGEQEDQKNVQNTSKTPEQYFSDSLKTPMVGLPEEMASMSLKELYDKKKEILDNWVHVFERKNNEELEKKAYSESLFYYLQISSIVNEIMSRVDDDKCKKQRECLDRIYKHIGQKDITELTSAFLDLCLIEYPNKNK